ncbi:MAG: tetratricopeptide repeat protein [Bacteroidota bacterium]|nr:tetratricopeptide repeat protein [Bacteroidota bacterium]
MTKKNLIAILFIIFSSYGFARYDYNINCKKAYQSIVSLRFSEGKRILEAEKIKDPGNDIPYYIENYIDYLTLFIGENESDLVRLEGNKDKRISRLEKGDQKSPYYLYCLGEIYLQWGLAKIKFHEYVKAVVCINKAYNCFTKNQKLFPDFVLNKKSMGLFHSIIGSIPDEYKWVVKLLGFKGSMKQGLEELVWMKDYAKKNKEYNFLRTESLFYLAIIQLKITNDDVNKLRMLDLDFEDMFASREVVSPLLYYSRANLLLRLNQNDKVLNMLLKRPMGSEYYPFYYLDYLTGLTKLNKLENDCGIYFVRYINGFKGKSYIQASWQKLAWICLLENNKAKYKEMINNVKKIDGSLIDEDKQALKEAESDEIPNSYLLKARLLCDGGYFSKALSILILKNATDSYTSSRDRLEFTYRLARIYHLMNDLNKAISYYEMTLKNGENKPYYFAANSSLQLGNIYETKGNIEKARYYYQKCLNIKGHEYKNSIDQKAKSGLNRINKN